MTTDCIFCKIAKGEAHAAPLFETERVLSFLDIAPVHPGHALVIPKAHYETIFDVPESLGTELLAVKKAVGQAILTATGATGLNIGQNNFRHAGQIVWHAHWHLIPRHANDGLRLWPQQAYSAPGKMEQMAQNIRDCLKSL